MSSKLINVAKKFESTIKNVKFSQEQIKGRISKSPSDLDLILVKADIRTLERELEKITNPINQKYGFNLVSCSINAQTHHQPKEKFKFWAIRIWPGASKELKKLPGNNLNWDRFQEAMREVRGQLTQLIPKWSKHFGRYIELV